MVRLVTTRAFVVGPARIVRQDRHMETTTTTQTTTLKLWLTPRELRLERARLVLALLADRKAENAILASWEV